MKSREEIRSEEEAIRLANSHSGTSKEFEPKKPIGPNSKGEIWINGYCRYRPPSYNTSNFDRNVSEVAYHRAQFPSDIIIYTDDFSGSGTIPWAENTNSDNKEACMELLKRIPAYAEDGLPVSVYDSLCRLSDYSESKHWGTKGREYEFSRAVSVWMKRKEGPGNMFVTYTTEFPFVNSADHVDFEFNDKGKFKFSVFCDNCPEQYKKVKSGTMKFWRPGDWNEITVKKDELNIISFYVNEELLYQYKMPYVLIPAHFGGFGLRLPYQWEKKGLKYNIRSITSIHYPKSE